MAILIGQSLIREGSAISELTRQAIAFIDGGSEWTRWALHGPEIKARFPDETQMAGGIQSGLHGTPFAYLRNLHLMVSPIKLMTFSLDDLRLTAEAELDPSNTKRMERVKAIFALHGLLTADQLAVGMKWLAGFKLPDAALFQVAGFDDQAALTELAILVDERPIDQSLSAEAASFAESESRTPLEFADFFRSYVGIAEKLAKRAPTADDRLAAAQSAVRLVSPLAFAALDCPQTMPQSGPDDVMLAVELWAASGRSIGFARVSACVREIILRTRFVGDERWFKKSDREAWAHNRFEAYVETARALTRRAKLTHPFMGQDGATCRYTLAAGDYVARLQLDPDGVISLSDLHQIVPIEAVIDPFKPSEHKAPTQEDAP